MAMRYRKSKKIAPGIKINLNKKSVSVTAGGKYGRITTGTSGKMTTSASIPGTGVYATNSFGGSGHKQASTNENYPSSDEDFIPYEDAAPLTREQMAAQDVAFQAGRGKIEKMQKQSRVSAVIAFIVFAILLVISIIRIFLSDSISGIALHIVLTVVFGLILLRLTNKVFD